jgi:hypothetical protein
VYQDCGWKGMGDWLGTGNIAPHTRKYRSFESARAFARRLHLRDTAEWEAFCKGRLRGKGKLPNDIPASPRRVYAQKGWISMGDWLGTGSVARMLRKFRTFKRARAFARKLKLGSSTQWRAFCGGKLKHLGKLPVDIPTAPHQVYEDSGWVSYGDWLGTGAVATFRRKYWPFSKARAYVRKLGLKKQDDWKDYCSKGKPLEIPSDVAAIYADSGWKGMGDWLGTKKVATQFRNYRNFKRARAYVRRLRLKDTGEWRSFCKGRLPKKGRLPSDIPANPDRVYAGKGWLGMGDWLGTGTVALWLRSYRPFGKARVFARSLRLKSTSEWFAFCKGELPSKGKLPADVPAAVHSVYAKKGWAGMADWLGTDRKGKAKRRR